jgi:hypothetical protein
MMTGLKRHERIDGEQARTKARDRLWRHNRTAGLDLAYFVPAI